MEIYDVKVRYGRKIRPADYEHMEAEVELSATMDANEEAMTCAEGLLVVAREQVHATLKGTIGKATETVTASTTAPAGRNITDAPEEREDAGGEIAYEDMTTGQKRAYTRRKNAEAAAAEAAATPPETKTEPTEVIDIDSEPTEVEKRQAEKDLDIPEGSLDKEPETDITAGDPDNSDAISGQELKDFIETTVRAAVAKKTMDGTDAINAAKRIITDVGDGAVAAMDVPAELRQAVHDAVTEAFTPKPKEDVIDL